MAQQVINVGAAPNDGSGDPLRTAYQKCNTNFSELYSRERSEPPPTLEGTAGDRAGTIAYDETYFYYCYQDYDGSSIIWAQVTNVGNVVIPQILNGNTAVDIPNLSSNVTISVNAVSNVAVFSSIGADISNLNIAGTLTVGGNSTVENLLPAANVTYDLGSANLQWSNLYLGGNSIHLSDAIISANANAITFTTGEGAEFIVSNLDDSTTLSSLQADALNITTTATIGEDILLGRDLIADGDILANGALAVDGSISGDSISATSAIVDTITASGNITTSGLFIGTFLGNITGNFVVPGSNTEVLFNNEGNAGASGNLTFNGATNLLNLTGNLSVSGNVQSGNLRTAGVISATGNINSASNIVSTANIIGGNLETTGQAIVIGNVTGGNISTAGLITATGNVTGGNVTTSGVVSATGNLVGGNILSAGIISVAGNITANNVVATSFSGTAANSIRVAVEVGTGLNADYSVPYFLLPDGTLTPQTDPSLVFNPSTNRLTVPLISSNVISANTGTYVDISGNLTGTTVSVTGNINGGNLSLTGNIVSGLSVTGNIIGGNITTPGILSSTGNITGGNIIATRFIGNVESTTLSATGNIQGGNLRTTGLISATGSITGASVVGGVITGTSTSVTGNITGGNLITAGLVSLSSITKTGSNGVGNIGSSTSVFNTVFAKATSAQYADIAENYLSDLEYEPGTVLCFGGPAEVTICNTDMSTIVAGVVSSAPAFLMNTGLGGQIVPLALLGRVPVKVKGPIRRGQMLVSTADGAARAEDNPKIGTVLGKALEDFDGEAGMIEVVIGRL